MILMMLIHAPLALISRTLRPWIVTSIIGFIGWASGPHWLRYLIPSLPVFALTGAALTTPLMKGKWINRLVWLCILMGGVLGLNGTPEQIKTNWDAYSQNRAPVNNEATAFCNAQLPDDATIALLFEWGSSDIDRRQILGSLEDHIPTRHFLLRHPGREVEALREAGTTHAIVRDTIFLPKVYPFLDAVTLHRDFNGPVRNLDESLSKKASLLFKSRTHRVYRLTPAP